MQEYVDRSIGTIKLKPSRIQVFVKELPTNSAD
ncbi:hypothetical protein MNBD_DELTA04-790, partial [hydrothermal vent metagenome]